MSTSQTTFLSKPVDGKRIAPEILGYMRLRAKRHAYDLVIREFKRAGISKAELARRLGKGADRVSKMLGGPGNWTISTVADLLFAISAAEPKWELDFPLDKPARNNTRPTWLLTEQQSIGSSGTAFLVLKPPGSIVPPLLQTNAHSHGIAR